LPEAKQRLALTQMNASQLNAGCQNTNLQTNDNETGFDYAQIDPLLIELGAAADPDIELDERHAFKLIQNAEAFSTGPWLDFVRRMANGNSLPTVLSQETPCVTHRRNRC